MWASLNRFLKRRAPSQQRLLKKVLRPWIGGPFSIPVPKSVEGRLCWVHPRLLTAEPTESHVLAWIRNCLGPGQVFFDVGAHYGWMSLIAAHRVGSGGRVIAFEPAAPLVEILQYHKRVNRLKQMDVVVSAVCDMDCQSVPFHLVNKGLSFGNSLIPHMSEGESTQATVSAVSLDTYCLQHNVWPDVVKIDVEGAEVLVLQGAASVLARTRPKLIVAVHPPWLPDGHTVAELFDIVASYEYRLQHSKVYRFRGDDFGDYLFSCDSAADRPGTKL